MRNINKKITWSLVFLLLFQIGALAVFEVRIKDIAGVSGARENQLMGFGLVVGLKNTGDSRQTGFTRQALTNLLSRMGIAPQKEDFKSKNVAAVMVTATLPPFINQGQKIDVTVSSLGDAASLQGGTLLITPLKGSDGKVYAVAQGPLSLGDTGGKKSLNYLKSMRQTVTTVARIPSGAIIEREVPMQIKKNNLLTIVLNKPDFTTANRVVYSILKAGFDARAKDAATIQIPLFKGVDLVSLISQIENLAVVPDVKAKIVVNERTGTVVIGENVRIAPVAITYSGMTVEIGKIDLYSQSNSAPNVDDFSSAITETQVDIKEREHKLYEIQKSASLKELVTALNAVGASPSELLAILEAIKAAGALSGEMEVI